MKAFKQYATNSLVKFLSILLLTIVITSCGKDGDPGSKGDPGAQGIPGKEGSVILTGTGAPSTVGNNGDMYLDKNTSNLYGPKTAAGWGTPLSLKGENGSAGTSGSTILNGTTVPTTVGINGDYYLNKTNADLYGPKTTSGWGTPINLKGNAKVIASTWMNLGVWFSTSVNYYRDSFYYIPNPILNAVGYTSLGDMLEKGGVLLVYFNHTDWNYQIPTTITTVYPNIYVNWQIASNNTTNVFLFTIAGVNNVALGSDLANTPNNGKYKLRYVLIPAGTQLPATANLKNMNYEQVKDLLKLKD